MPQPKKSVFYLFLNLFSRYKALFSPPFSSCFFMHKTGQFHSLTHFRGIFSRKGKVVPVKQEQKPVEEVQKVEETQTVEEVNTDPAVIDLDDMDLGEPMDDESTTIDF